MLERRYQQYCALARTLDVAGDRWTLPIVRELAPGPRRFADLVDGQTHDLRKVLSRKHMRAQAEATISRDSGHAGATSPPRP